VEGWSKKIATMCVGRIGGGYRKEIGDYGINDCSTGIFQGILVERSGRRLVG